MEGLKMNRPQFGSVQVHRLGGDVALAVSLKPNPSWGRRKGEGVQAYITPQEALDLAEALQKAADEISQGVRFVDSTVGTYSAEVAGDRQIL
jgi:hypothetical protein